MQMMSLLLLLLFNQLVDGLMMRVMMMIARGLDKPQHLRYVLAVLLLDEIELLVDLLQHVRLGFRCEWLQWLLLLTATVVCRLLIRVRLLLIQRLLL